MASSPSQWPAFTEGVEEGYKLTLKVGSATTVPPPPELAALGSDNIWSFSSWSALLVAAEYCAALNEFVIWTFPIDWECSKAAVAGYACDFIRTQAFVPCAPESDIDPNVVDAHHVWSCFTYCFFNGTGDISATSRQQDSLRCRQAVDWLEVLVGETGWRANGKVVGAIRDWVSKTKARVEAMSWEGVPEVDTRRTVAIRGTSKAAVKEAFTATFPYHTCYPSARVNIKIKGKEKPPRSIRDLAGKCGVPPGTGQSQCCAIMLLVVADLLHALEEIHQRWPETLRAAMIDAFYAYVLNEDKGPLCGDGTRSHEFAQHGYPSHVRACALGWELALGHVKRWVAAAEALAVTDAARACGRRGLQLTLPEDTMRGPARRMQLQQVADAPPAGQAQQSTPPPKKRGPRSSQAQQPLGASFTADQAAAGVGAVSLGAAEPGGQPAGGAHALPPPLAFEQQAGGLAVWLASLAATREALAALAAGNQPAAEMILRAHQAWLLQALQGQLGGGGNVGGGGSVEGVGGVAGGGDGSAGPGPGLYPVQ